MTVAVRAKLAARRVASPRLRRVRSGVFTPSATVHYLRAKRATTVIAC